MNDLDNTTRDPHAPDASGVKIDGPAEYFTIVFDGRLRDIKQNPFNVESAFGKVVAVGLGDAIGRQETVEDLLACVSKASELATIAIDWNLDEAEIGGHMESVSDLRAEFDCAIAKATGAP